MLKVCFNFTFKLTKKNYLLKCYKTILGGVEQ
jgi:hypothetical protein